MFCSAGLFNSVSRHDIGAIVDSFFFFFPFFHFYFAICFRHLAGQPLDLLPADPHLVDLYLQRFSIAKIVGLNS